MRHKHSLRWMEAWTGLVMGSQVWDFRDKEVGSEVGTQVGLGCNFCLLEVPAQAESKPMAELESENPEPVWDGFSNRLDPKKANNQHGTSSGLRSGAEGILAGHKKDSSELCGGGSGRGLLLCHCWVLCLRGGHCRKCRC